MTRLLKKIRQIYGDMNLQSKFTIVLSIAVTIPVLIVGIFFYTRLMTWLSLIPSEKNRMHPPRPRL